MTQPLRIASVAAFLQRVQGPPPNYGPALKAVCKNVPRRINRFIQLNLLGAHQCVNGSGRPLAPDCGVYLGSAEGNTGDTVHLLRQVFQTRETPNPVTFINSSTNVASYYLAQTLKLHGRNLPIASTDFSFEAALDLACLDVADATVPMGLVGAVDQGSDQSWVGQAGPRGALDELDVSVWLLLDPAHPRPLAEIEWVRRANTLEDVAAWPEAGGAAGMPRYLALGRGLTADARGALAQRFSGWTAFTYRDELPDFEVQSAYGIVQFIEARKPGRLLHIAGNGQGACYGVCLTAPERAGRSAPAA
jgi:hypothetical protein